MKVHVFQIGCQDIGRMSFEKLLEFEEYFPVDVVFEGVHCKDFEAEERAQKFAESAINDIKFFDGIDKLYSTAQEVDGEVLIYDAGPPQLHSRNIAESLRQGFHHLTEKPPSMTRKEHLAERKLAANSNINYKVDFIERENPVVQKIEEIVDGENIGSVKVFRESSFGVQKILDPVNFSHVKGGCVLDKLSNDIFVLDFLETNDFEFIDADIDYLMPKKLGGERVLSMDGSGSRKIDEKTAVGKCSAKFESNNTKIELYGSWLGLSKESKELNDEIKSKFGEQLIRSNHREINGKGFEDSECRFFAIEGTRDLVGDLLNHKIHDLDSEERIEVPSYPRDQLYRVLEKAVLDAAGADVPKVDEEEIDSFMNGLFDIQDQCGGEIFEEVDKATEKIRSLMTSDKKFSEEAEVEGIAR